MRRKNCDAIVLNGRENIGTERARVEFLIRGGAWERWPMATKARLARRLVGELVEMMGE